MNSYKKIYGFFYKVSTIISVISEVAALVVIVCTTIDIILRLISRTSPQINLFVKGNFEITTMLMIPMVFFAYAITEMEDTHVKVQLIVEKLKPAGKRIARCVTSFIAVVIGVFLFWSCILQNQAHLEGNQTTSVLFWPYPPFSLIMTIGVFIFLICLILKFIGNVISVIEKGDDWKTDLPGYSGGASTEEQAQKMIAEAEAMEKDNIET